MQYREIKPIPALQPFIECYWTLKNSGKNTFCNQILPDCCIDIIFNFGANCEVEDVALESGKTYIAGAMTSYQTSNIFPEADLLGIRFKPFAFNLLNSFSSLHEITNATIEFDGKHAPDLLKVSEFSYSYLDKYFIDKGITGARLKALAHSINLIENTSGTTGIEDFAERFHISVRQLERLFRKELGLTPKEFLRIVRNQAALQKIKQRSPGTPLLQIALEYGYYDHSHLCREIKKFSGEAPSFF